MTPATAEALVPTAAAFRDLRALLDVAADEAWADDLSDHRLVELDRAVARLQMARNRLKASVGGAE